MSCFEIPISLCIELEGIMTNFWCDDQNDNRKIHQVSWDKICWPRKVSGLEFKDLHRFNLAVLAKQGWRLMTNDTSFMEA